MRSEQAESSELSRRLTIALVTPIILLVTMGTLLGFQVLRMSDDAHWVDHTDEVIATAVAVQKQIIDQETGLRGLPSSRTTGSFWSHSTRRIHSTGSADCATS